MGERLEDVMLVTLNLVQFSLSKAYITFVGAPAQHESDGICRETLLYSRQDGKMLYVHVGQVERVLLELLVPRATVHVLHLEQFGVALVW